MPRNLPLPMGNAQRNTPTPPPECTSGEYDEILHLGRISRPTTYLHLTDTTSRGRGGFKAQQYFYYRAQSEKAVHARHLGAANGVFLDGHAECLRRRQIEDLGIRALYETDFNAVSFGKRLTARERAEGRLPEGVAYRLPTEAEWEFAARAGTTTRFSHGDDPGYEQLRLYAWYGGNSGLRTHPVAVLRRMWLCRDPMLFWLIVLAD